VTLGAPPWIKGCRSYDGFFHDLLDSIGKEKLLVDRQLDRRTPGRGMTAHEKQGVQVRRATYSSAMSAGPSTSVRCLRNISAPGYMDRVKR
jgi:hypothetical protein